MGANSFYLLYLKIVFIICIVTFLSCNDRHAVEYPDVYDYNQVAIAENGIVVSAAHLATRAGVEILERGGNAVDAAVATAFALAVVEPSMSGIGGRTQILLRTPEGEFYGIDGTTQVPSGFDPAVHDAGPYGYGNIAVPGTVSALGKVIEEFGSLTLSEVMEPAIILAERGFELSEGEAARIAGAIEELLEFDGSRKHFLKQDGSPYEPGELFIQPTLARTLRKISEGGVKEFYHGSIAQKIAEEMKNYGGYIGLEDLERYSVQEAKVVNGSYRNVNLTGTYRPASGATTIQILQMMEHFDLPEVIDSSEWITIVAQALLLGFEDRTKEAELIVSKEWAAERAREINIPKTVIPVEEDELKLNVGMDHTTHLSVADNEGWFVALNQSIGPSMGSKVASEDMGFLYAATMGYLGSLPPGTRATTSMSPLIVYNDDNVYVLGAAGGRRIITSIVLTLSRLIDQNLSLPEAIASPRFHASSATIHLEDFPDIYWDEDVHKILKDYSYEINLPERQAYFGRIHGIHYKPESGEFIGVADPRWEGTAKSPDDN